MKSEYEVGAVAMAMNEDEEMTKGRRGFKEVAYRRPAGRLQIVD